jgi:hypothetical protein
MRKFFLRLNPQVKKIWLQVMAGLSWSAVGIMLIIFALSWLKLASDSIRIFLLISGGTLAAGIYLWGFSKIARKNIIRIEAYVKDKVCLFAFQKWSSYPLVLVMINLGIYLRKYSPLPKNMLAVLYIGIGGGLFLSSVHYHKVIYGWVSDQKTLSHIEN